MDDFSLTSVSTGLFKRLGPNDIFELMLNMNTYLNRVANGPEVVHLAWSCHLSPE